MKIHQMTVAEALASLHSRAAGLGSVEAAHRLAEYGPNVVQAARRESFARRLAREYFGFFSLILWVASALAFIAEWRDPGQGMAKIGFTIVAVILVSGAFSFWQEHRIEQSLAALRKLLPQQIPVQRDGAAVALPIEQLVPGDIVLIEAGQSVPADCRLIESHGVRVNTATITGESEPKARDAMESREDLWNNSRNILLAGTSVVSGRARALVFATGAHTEFGKIAQLTQTAGDTVSPLRLELAHLSRRIAWIALAIGGGFMVVASLLGIPFWQDLIFSIGIIVAMVPEGLLPTLTLALVLASQRLARRQVLIRHLPAVETLGSATVICTDKTGTLTQNRMQVRTLLLGLELHPMTALADDPVLVERNRFLFAAAAACHSLVESLVQGRPTLQGDSMEIALVEMAHSLVMAQAPARRVGEWPFDSDRMRQSVQVETSAGCTLFCKGAPETVLPLCAQIFAGGQARPLDAAARAEILAAQERMAVQGLRVLAFAFRVTEVCGGAPLPEQELVFCGLVGLEDPPRPEVPEAVRQCREAGIRVIMVTGDHPHTAVALAREIGLVQSPDPLVLTGAELQRLSATQLQLALDAPDIVFARLAADQKMRIVNALRDKQHIVAVTGDGVNDAPALKAAHIGIAMGRSGTDVAKQAADMILLDDNFASIVNAVEEGRAVFANIRKFLTYILTSNIPELIPYLAFVLFRIPLPLTIIQILAVDLGTDMLPALALGAEKPDPEIMQRPPRAKNERLLSWGMLARAYLFLGMLEAAAAMAIFFIVLHGTGWVYGDMPAASDPHYLQATTACLASIVVMQMMNVFLCRHPKKSTFSFGVFSNPYLLLGLATELGVILLITYTPAGHWLFGTAAIGSEVWLLAAGAALLMLLLEELRKLWLRSRPVS